MGLWSGSDSAAPGFAAALSPALLHLRPSRCVLSSSRCVEGLWVLAGDVNGSRAHGVCRRIRVLAGDMQGRAWEVGLLPTPMLLGAAPQAGRAAWLRPASRGAGDDNNELSTSLRELLGWYHKGWHGVALN